jgi:hypothetical protein
MRMISKNMVAPLTCFFLLQILIFSRMMNFEMRKDEQLYAPPARLLREYSLYSDIFYNHTPGSAWLFYATMNCLGTDHLLLAARLGVFLAWAVFGLGLIAITYKLTRSSTMASLAVLLIMTNEALLNQTGMTATNNLLPLAAAYLGLGVFLLGVNEGKIRTSFIVSSGFMLSTAAVFKANAFVFIPFVAAGSFFLPRGDTFVHRLKRVVAPLAVGGIVGALPVLAYLAADAPRFAAHVIGFHTGPHIAYWLAQAANEKEVVATTIASKGLLAYSIWFNNANLLFVFSITFLLACLAAKEPFISVAHRLFSSQILFVLTCLFGAVVMSFVPTPGFPQYFALPLACAPLLLALLYAQLDEDGKQTVQPGLIAISIVTLLSGLPQLGEYALRLPFPSSWTVERVHRAGIKIADKLAEAGVSGKIATLAPIYPLEGSLSVYPELATGQFAYRTAEFTDANLRKYYRSTSTSEISAFLKADPPAGILVGFEPKLEAPMVQFAEQNGYLRIDNLGISDRYGQATLYIRTTSEPSN